MNAKSLFLGVVILCLIGSETARATVFPAEIQACISGGACTGPVQVQQTSTFTAYLYFDGGTQKFLLEYVLGHASNESTNQNTTQLSGNAWLSADAVYDLTQERHLFTLYLDRVTPTPTNLWVFDSDGLDVGLSLTTADLLAGSGFFHLGETSGSEFFLEGELGTLGDLGQGGYPLGENHSFVPCLAATCEVGAELNLLNIDYVQVGSTAELAIDPTDQRTLLYSQFRDHSDPSWFRSQTYAVVPEPTSASLLASALGLFGMWRCRRVRHALGNYGSGARAGDMDRAAIRDDGYALPPR